MWQETIQIKGPYDFDRVLERLSLDPLQAVDLKNKILKMPLWIAEEPVVVEIHSIGTVDNPKFQLSSTIEPQKTIEKVSKILQWGIPLLDIHHHFSQTDLKEIFDTHYGTPLVLDFDPYNCLLKCIIHQQLNLAFAHKLTERFVQTYGFEKDGVWFYPQPEKTASLTVEELRTLQFSGRKAEYAIGVSQAIISGEINLETIKELSEEEIFAKLIKLKGVGPWTIQNLMMFGYGKLNLFPIADIGIQNALKKHYKLDRKPTIEEIEQYKTPWEPYLSYASLYLWRSIE
ncbi:DNA-3-methyladenine glycosylase family protein [Bacillus sp. CGMCC 1.16607]|uniref:DNA-3-methyladenine glycosylase family protein n=1 Tax=Bacillus sp. CGMCC 1.16607 TaxID=3351842 RepID=UPI00363D7559